MKFREWLSKRLSDIGTWALAKSGTLMAGSFPADKVESLIRREVAVIPSTVDALLRHTATEESILDARLARRYDPGMALNESFNRAIEAKRAGKAEFAAAIELTPLQKKALAVQQETLERILKKA